LNQALPFYLTLTQTWIYFTYGENALVYQFGIISSLAWSISTEWFFYCAYPFICYGLSCFARTQDKFMIAILTCVVAVGLIVTVGRFADPINEFAVSQFGAIADKARWQDSFLRWLLSFSPYSRIFEFLLGCICAAIYLDMADRVPTRTEERRGLLLLACAIVAIVALHIFF
jgi:peptidoglycan/LPS O-acetylase OafA/YrhL